MIKFSECRAWIHHQYTELPLYMIVRLVKGGRIYSFTFCINVNETLEKDTEILKIDKIGENEPTSTITEKRG